MKNLFVTALVFILLLKLQAQAPEKEYGLAKIGKKIEGVLIFINCDPYYEYDYIATVKVTINWTGTTYESFERAIKKAKKHYPYFNGMIFQKDNYSKADLIKFKGLEVSRGGFAIGAKVSFIEEDILNVGEVVALETSKNKASIKYINIYGEERIKEIDYTDLTPLSPEPYQEKIEELKKKIEAYKFKIGEKIYWIKTDSFGQNSKQIDGEVINLDDKYHKASIKYIDEKNQEKIVKVSYLKLIKSK